MPYVVRDVIHRLQRDGWIHRRTRGSHRTFEKVGSVNKIVVPGKDGDELSPGVYGNIARYASWK